MFRRWSPLLRITSGLVALTATLLLLAQFVGLVPDEAQAILEGRRKFVETLAVQLSAEGSNLSVDTVQAVLTSIVERNDDVRSTALRDANGQLVVSAGDHRRYWEAPPSGRSTDTAVQVPIFSDELRWGTVEVSFKPIPSSVSLLPTSNPLLQLVLFIGVTGALGYFLMLRRSLKALDPSAVIPERVRTALDALAEGMVIIDGNEQIVLANASISNRLGVPARSLMGRNFSDLNWRSTESGGLETQLPWQAAMASKVQQTGLPLLLRTPSGEMLSFNVNGTPILDEDGKLRGALVTLDDVTLLEQRHNELQRTMGKLKHSQDEIERQNTELRFLASRDTLTGCLNRRAFFAGFEELLVSAEKTGQVLCCAMLDIDHFKSVNDRFGHATGDKVIAFVAQSLQSGLRDGDLLGRYGGEEFALVMPGLGLDEAMVVVERLRLSIEQGSAARFTSTMKITISGGLAGQTDSNEVSAELLSRADTALYIAKQSGRNRTVNWQAGQSMAEKSQRRRTDRPETAELQAEARQTVPGDDAESPRVRELTERIRELEVVAAERATAGNAGDGLDALTGLPDSILFQDRLTQSIGRARRNATIVGVLHVEVDVFQRVKDTLGPAAGDHLIRSAAERISGLLRRSDTVALLGGGARPATVSRLGGADFAIVLSDLGKVDAVTWIIQRIFESVSAPLKLDEHEFYMSCTIGASVFPHDDSDNDALLSHASAARQYAKQRPGSNRYAFYTPEITEQSYQQLQMENDLRQAIGRGEFVLHYQPKVDMLTGRATGVEALLRWQHPERGLVEPRSFVPIAEQTGLINVIGDWALHKACRQARLWQRIGLESLRVAVNLSPVQLLSDDIVDKVESTLETTGLEARFLEIEITESAFMEDITRAAQTLQKLRSLGVHISLDDFGTGYSSLSYLKRLPVDSLKIDRSFISDIAVNREDTAMVSAIIAMAQRLGIRVVAEGVETREQLRTLRQLGCDELQGYLISRPLPGPDAVELFRSGTTWRHLFDEERPSEWPAAAVGGAARPGSKVVYMAQSRARQVE